MQRDGSNSEEDVSMHGQGPGGKSKDADVLVHTLGNGSNTSTFGTSDGKKCRNQMSVTASAARNSSDHRRELGLGCRKHAQVSSILCPGFESHRKHDFG